MLDALKNLGRAIIPLSLFRAAQPYYHGLVALLANWYFGQPSKKMVVIGITGTAGKSTTANMLAAILNHAGHKTGFITTANYSDGEREYANKHGLSMPGGFLLQQQLATMVQRGCRYVIIEATSEGLAQNRHLGINFNAALLTGLAPAHLDAHGGFNRYRAAKGKLFAALKPGQNSILGVNLDAADAGYFLDFQADKKFGVTLRNQAAPELKTYLVTDAVTEPQISFHLNGEPFALPLIGEFNIYNAALAAATADMLDVPLTTSAEALRGFAGVSGRLETIPNRRGALVFVDYAPEPSGMENSLHAVSRLPHNRIIHIFGSTGGHRDINKRFQFGAISASLADIIIITNDDVYDSDPQKIADDVRQGIDTADNKKVTEIITVLDRRQAIKQGLSLAQPGDIIIITGKGSEQFLVLPGNKRVDWDEPSVVREELEKI